jgi:hypothetical protein
MRLGHRHGRLAGGTSGEPAALERDQPVPAGVVPNISVRRPMS